MTAGWRTHRVWPSVGGHNTSLVARIGDWTWQAVAEAYDLDVLTARTGAGAPAYLSFHYCRYRASPALHLRTPTFGDRLAVASGVLGAGPQSTLTLHRLRCGDDLPDEPLENFWAPVPDGELRVEHLNRWITPLGDSNTELASTVPVGFDASRVTAVPAAYSPRGRIRQARLHGSFRPDGTVAGDEPCRLTYAVDAARDLNAVGLMYFAAYSGLVDWALWQAWRHWGRTDASFLERVVVDQELLYQGNADAGSLLHLTVQRFDTPETEVVDVVVTRAPDHEPLAVCTLTLLPRETA